MRFIWGVDYHLKSTRLDIGIRLLQATTKAALKHRCSHIIIGGDLIDERHGMRIEVLQALYQEMERSRKKGVTWVWLRGNHEIGVKSEPHKTVMTLFAGVCHSLVEPAIWELPDVVLFFLPWYLPQQYILLASSLASTSRSYGSKLKVLLSHVGLDEGKASPSNMYVNQAVRLRDLHEDAYDRVLLGDYHVRQWLSDRTLYGGVPISHCHGDDTSNGVWLVDTQNNSLEAIALEDKFPRHLTWQVPDPNKSILFGYDPQDYNRIVIPRDYKNVFAALYPSAQFQFIGEEPDGTDRRLASVEQKGSPEAIWHEFVKLKTLPSQQQELGLQILQEVSKRRWETQK